MRPDWEIETSLDVIYRAINEFEAQSGGMTADLASHIRIELLRWKSYHIGADLGAAESR